MKFHASNIRISTAGGEYFTVGLSESKAEGCPYVLVQNSFEFSRGPAYFECHDFDLAGHGRVKHCELRRASLEIDLSGSAEHITVTFEEADEKIGNLAWMLGIIFAGTISFVNSSGVPENPIDDPDF